MIIYKAQNHVNGKCYIGQTIKSLQERKIQHFRDSNKNSELAFHRALRKYGQHSFTFEIIDKAETIDDLNEKEVYWIRIFNSFGEKGYNMTLGGEGKSGYVMSDESKQKMSASLKGRKPTEEARINMSKAHIGITLSDETKMKISKIHKGRVFTDETRKKMSDWQIGRKLPLDTKNKLSKLNKGSGNPSAKLTEDSVRDIKLMLKEGEFSQTKIAEMYGVSKGIVSSIKLGKLWKHVS